MSDTDTLDTLDAVLATHPYGHVTIHRDTAKDALDALRRLRETTSKRPVLVPAHFHEPDACPICERTPA